MMRNRFDPNNRFNRYRLALALGAGVIVAGAFLVLFVTAARAEDRDGKWAAQDPALHEWFDKLSSGKGLCCSFADGVKVDDPDVDMHDLHYYVRMCPRTAALPGGWPEDCKKEWVVVPDDALILEPNRARHAVVWPFKQWDAERGDWETKIRCFIPGPGA
jgi:hypothetical protein